MAEDKGWFSNNIFNSPKDLKEAFYTTYINRAHIDTTGMNEDKIKRKLAKVDTKTAAAAFFGLPWNKSDQNGLTVRNVLKNMTGWTDSHSTFVNLLKALPVFLFRSVGVVAQTGLNVLKLVTEFLPKALLKLSSFGLRNFLLEKLKNSGGKEIKNEDYISLPEFEDYKPLKATEITTDCENQTFARKLKPLAILRNVGIVLLGALKALAIVALVALFIAAKALFLVGRAITSPMNAMQTAFEAGQELVQNYDKNTGDKKEKTPAQKVVGLILGGFLATLSLTITAAAYIVMFPLAIKLIATNVIPVVANFATTVLSPAAVTWLAGASTAITGALSTVGAGLTGLWANLAVLTGVTEAAVLGAAALATGAVVVTTALGKATETAVEAIDKKLEEDVKEDKNISKFYKVIKAPGVNKRPVDTEFFSKFKSKDDSSDDSKEELGNIKKPGYSSE